MRKLRTLLLMALMLCIGRGSIAQTTYSPVEWSNILPTDVIIITMTTNSGNGTMYAMKNNDGTSNSPKALAITYSSGNISITNPGYTMDVIKWNIDTVAGKIYPVGSTSTWLYTTNSNSGVRIGTNTNGIWSLDGNYLKTTDGTNDRWLGVFSGTDWRAYKNTTSNIVNQVVGFYKEVAGATTTVATPSFSPAAGSYLASQSVAINCSTANATIYYTTDNSDPTSSSSVYSTPIQVAANTTIKAMAAAAGMTNSAIASATYTFPTPITIAAARALANNNMATVQGIVTYMSGRNVYIQDTTAAINVYFNSNTVPTTLAIGDEIIVTGKRAVYNGLVQLSGINGGSASSFHSISTGNQLPLAIKTIAEINSDYAADNLLQSTRVKIVDATIGVINNNGSTPISQEDDEMNIYRLPVVEGLMVGDWVTLIGIIGCYNAPQLYVNSASDVQYTHRPNLFCNPNSLNGFNYVVGEGPSETQSFNLTGSYLTGSVSIIPSDNYEISFVDGALFTPENPGLIYPPSSGNIYGLNVYVRLKSGLELGTYNESIALLSANADTVYVNVTGSVVEQGGGSADDYVRILDLDDLTEGSQVVLAARFNATSTDYYAMENTTSGKPNGVLFTSTTSGIDEILPSSITDNEGAYYWTVGFSGDNYTFTNADGDTLGYSSSTNFSTGGENVAWTVAAGTSYEGAMVPNYDAFTIINTNNNGRAVALNTSYKFGAYATSNMTNSNAANYNYYIDLFVKQTTGPATVVTPVFSPVGGTYYEPQTVSITCATDDASIYYTLDGTTPTANSTLYSAPITVSETTTVNAIAIKEGMNTSVVATAVYTIQIGVSVVFDQDWEVGMEGWTFVSTEGTGEWTIASYSNNHYAYMNGYGSGANVDWCISPAFNINDYTNRVLTFRTAKNYTGPDLEVFFSNDYNGTSPATATWIPLICNLSTGSWTWVESGAIDLSNFSGTNCYIGFKYTSTESEQAGWEVDDILLVGNTTNPVITVAPNSLNGFQYIVGNGPSAEQSFLISAINLTADLTITPSANYEISTTSGASFAAQTSVVLTPASGSVAETTLYVRLKADLIVGDYNNEQIIASSTGANNAVVTCSGSVVEEGSNSDWRRIYDVSELVVGCRIIFASRYDAAINNGYYVMTASATGKPEGVLCSSVMSGNDEIMPSDIASSAETYYWTVGMSGSNYVFTNANGDVLGYSSGTNFATGGDNTAWSISWATSGDGAMVPNYAAFNIINVNNDQRGIAQNTSHNFGPYSITNINAADYNFFQDIFMQGEAGTPMVAAPVFNPQGGTYYETQNVNITCSTDGASVLYSLQSENGPWVPFTSPIVVDESATIWAYAEKEDYDDSPVVSATYVINSGVTVIFNQDWENDWNGWTSVSVEGTSEWTIASYGGNHYAYANGYNDGANEDWLLSPAFNLNDYSDVVLSFKTAMNYTGAPIEVFFSNDYDGSDVSTATWQPISCTLSSGSWEWTESGEISMDPYSGTNCYIAFKYTCTDTESSAWEVDDILLMTAQSGPSIVANPTTINNLTYLFNNGPSASQSFTLNAAELEGEGNISVSAGDSFEISLDDAVFASTIEIAFANGSIINQSATVYVRLMAGLEVGTYQGTVTCEGGNAQCVVNVNGEVTSDTAPAISEELLPMYIQGMNGTNNNRVPFAFRLTLVNFTPNTTYRYINQIVDGNDGATANGAGNVIFVNGEDFYRTTSPSMENEGNYGVFTTDASGSYSGWFMSEATANTRFTPGNNVYMRLRINDGNDGTTAVTYLTTSETATVINYGTENDETQGTAIRAISSNSAKDFVFLYDDVNRSDRPIYGTSIETTGIDYASISQYATFYKNEVAGNNGSWGGIIPNVLQNGIRYIEVLSNVNGEINDSYTSEDGQWGLENTVNPVGGLDDVIVLNLLGLSVEDAPEANVTIWNAQKEIVVVNAESTDFQMTVYNALGQALLQKQVLANTTQRFDHNLSAGIYIIRLQNNVNTVSSKIIVR